MLEARWVVTSNDDNHVILILSEDRFDLSPPIGRRSFKGFNPSLDSLMEEKIREHRQARGRKAKREAKLEVDAQDPTAVSDASMADFAVASKRKR